MKFDGHEVREFIGMCHDVYVGGFGGNFNPDFKRFSVWNIFKVKDT